MSVELALMAERSTSEHFSREPVFLKFVGCLPRDRDREVEGSIPAGLWTFSSSLLSSFPF